MNKTVTILIASLFSLIFSRAAIADSKFDGLYAGFQTGHGKVSDVGSDSDLFQKGFYTISPSGTIFGAYVGYNRVFEGGFLLGVESGYEQRGWDDESELVNVNGALFTGYRYPIKTKIDNATSLKIRVGSVFNNGSTLAYITAGYVVSKIKRTFDYYDLDISEVAPENSQTQTNRHKGALFGLGVEQFITDKVTFKGEYSRSSFNSLSIEFSERNGWSLPIDSKVKNEDLFRFGISYHF